MVWRSVAYWHCCISDDPTNPETILAWPYLLVFFITGFDTLKICFLLFFATESALLRDHGDWSVLDFLHPAIHPQGERIRIVSTLLTSHIPYLMEKLPAHNDNQYKFDLLASSMNLLPSLLCTYVGNGIGLYVNCDRNQWRVGVVISDRYIPSLSPPRCPQLMIKNNSTQIVWQAHSFVDTKKIAKINSKFPINISVGKSLLGNKNNLSDNLRTSLHVKIGFHLNKIIVRNQPLV